MKRNQKVSPQDIYRLDIVSRKNLSTKIRDSSVKYFLEQFAFISLFALSHFRKTSEPFILELDSKKAKSFIPDFVQFDLQFHTISKLIINQQNGHNFY